MELFKLFETAATTVLFKAYDVNNMKSVCDKKVCCIFHMIGWQDSYC